MAAGGSASTPASASPETPPGAGASIVSAFTPKSSRPAFARAQVPPPSRLLKTPPPNVPAYTLAGVNESITIDFTAAVVENFSVQVVPPSVLLKILPPPRGLKRFPVPVPAYRVVGVRGSIANVSTNSTSLGNGNPPLLGLQCAPRSVLLKMPSS